MDFETWFKAQFGCKAWTPERIRELKEERAGLESRLRLVQAQIESEWELFIRWDAAHKAWLARDTEGGKS